MEKKYSLDLEIYSRDLIRQAIIDFDEVVKIKFIDGNIFIEGKNELEIDEVFNEFGNYVIGLYNEK